ncbi:hypothetical protein NQ318_016319 [Aromia moschata]|uniref:Uncharacterized protein n=1 Tax=Aromia moschata TaxID=1265417 RepID=A0AAV8Z5D5_9CUCU|nr:hypothetical protein NQ318_016319 [Aromia moschata]
MMQLDRQIKKKRTLQGPVRLFQEKYPELPPISQGTVSKIEKQFWEHGHVRQLKKNPPNKLSDDQKLDDRAKNTRLEENPVHFGNYQQRSLFCECLGIYGQLWQLIKDTLEEVIHDMRDLIRGKVLIKYSVKYRVSARSFRAIPEPSGKSRDLSTRALPAYVIDVQSAGSSKQAGADWPSVRNTAPSLKTFRLELCHPLACDDTCRMTHSCIGRSVNRKRTSSILLITLQSRPSSPLAIFGIAKLLMLWDKSTSLSSTSVSQTV